MSTWKARASAASITGACVFAVVSGAGAVFVGDWWGQHHGPVVIQFINGPTSGSRAGTSQAATFGQADARTHPSPATSTATVPAEPDSDISKIYPRASRRPQVSRAPQPAQQHTIAQAGTTPPTATVGASSPAATPSSAPPSSAPPSSAPPSSAPSSAPPTSAPPATSTPDPTDPPSSWMPPSGSPPH